MKMFGRVLIWRGIAAADMATRHAEAQVHPGAADAQTIFTSVRAGRDFFDLIEVCTFHACDLSNVCRVYFTLSHRT